MFVHHVSVLLELMGMCNSWGWMLTVCRVIFTPAEIVGDPTGRHHLQWCTHRLPCRVCVALTMVHVILVHDQICTCVTAWEGLAVVIWMDHDLGITETTHMASVHQCTIVMTRWVAGTAGQWWTEDLRQYQTWSIRHLLPVMVRY